MELDVPQAQLRRPVCVWMSTRQSSLPPVWPAEQAQWGAGRHQRVEHSATSGYAETPNIHWTSLSIRMAVDAQNFFHIN